MKKVLQNFTVTTLLLATVWACKEQGSNQEDDAPHNSPVSEEPNGNISQKDRFTGRYGTEYDPNVYYGEVHIDHYTDDTLFFSIIIGSAEGCTGDVEGKAYFKNSNVAYYSIPDCPGLEFEFRANGELLVDEAEGCMLHGSECGFGNVYRLIKEEPEFSGVYEVGGVRCEVVPTKMAFEVNWANSQEPEMYFFREETPEGKMVFDSEDATGGRNKFVLDPEYQTGVFVSAKGGVTDVRHIK